jgi:hypothetical protein
MEDEPDKLRRNTLMFSVFTTIFNFLGLKFPSEFLSFSIPANSEIKIWFLILVFSLYFFARYHFCDESKNNARKASVMNRSLLPYHRQKAIEIMFWLHNRGLTYNFLSTYILEAQEAASAHLRVPESDLTPTAISLGAYDVQTSEASDNRAQLNFLYLYDGRVPNNTDRFITIEFPKLFESYVWIRKTISLVFNFEFIINIYMPYILFFCSALCVAYRFWIYRPSFYFLQSSVTKFFS